jgi:hypothetical protein
VLHSLAKATGGVFMDFCGGNDTLNDVQTVCDALLYVYILNVCFQFATVFGAIQPQLQIVSQVDHNGCPIRIEEAFGISNRSSSFHVLFASSTGKRFDFIIKICMFDF